MHFVEVAQGRLAGDPRPAKLGWFRLTLRSALAIGMAFQLIVLSDLKTVVLGGQQSLAWFTGIALRPTIFAVFAAASWATAFWWGRSRRATGASAMACLFSWWYYTFFPPSGEWCFFATSQHFLLFLLPLFPLLLLATITVLRDAVVDGRHLSVPQPQTAGLEPHSISRFTAKLVRASRTSVKSLEDSALFVPSVYGFTALVFLLHPDWFRWNEEIHSALRQSWNFTWPYNFAWLPQLAAIALIIAAFSRNAASGISRKVALFGSVVGCAYSVLALEAMNQHLIDAKRYPTIRATPLAPDSYYFTWLGVSLAPVLCAVFFAIREAKKNETISAISLRVTATLCFSVFALSAHFQENRPASGFQWIVLVFGVAYLSSVLYPSSWHDYVLGASVGLAMPVFYVFGFFHPHVTHDLAAGMGWTSTIVPYQGRDALLLLGITSTNMLLVFTVAANAVAKEKTIRLWRAAAGLAAALLFDLLIFIALLAG